MTGSHGPAMPRLPANEMRCIDFQPAAHATVSMRTRCVSSDLPSPPKVPEGGPRVGLATRLGVAARTAEEEGMRVVPNVPFGVMPEQHLT